MRVSSAVLVLLVVILAVGDLPSYAQGCGIGVAVQTQVVNLPQSSLPSNDGLTFAEVINVNYSSRYDGQTLSLQYMKGSEWIGLYNFTGNEVGFTEIDRGLDAHWASFGTNTIRVAGPGCTSDSVSFLIHGDQIAIVLDSLVYLAVILFLVFFLKLGVRIGWKRFAFLAGAVYLAISPFFGQRYDVYFLFSSGIRILQHVNPFDPGNPPLYPGALKWAYPPLYPLYSAFSYACYQLLTGASLPSISALTYPGWFTSTYSVYLAFVPPSLPLLVEILKLPMVISALLTGVLLNRISGKETPAIWWVANPLVILVSAVWGQIDPIATVFAVASVYLFQRNRPYQAYFFASVGAAVKVWPLLLVPFFMVIEGKKGVLETLKHLLAVIPVLLATVAIYALYGNPLESILLLVNARSIPTFAGSLSVNGLTWQQLLAVIGAPPIPFFLLVGVPVYCFILFRMHTNHDEDVLKWLVVSILVFYLTYNYVNPQYFYWIVPFLILQRRRLATIVFTLLPLVYAIVTYNVFYFVSPSILHDEFALGASVLEQLKVSFFYQSSAFLGIVAGAIPTLAYSYLLYRELKSVPKTSAKDQEDVKRSGVGHSPGEQG